jgi:L-alanine-DL-glutamate epimerase-like enolase superfamily enzyme
MNNFGIKPPVMKLDSEGCVQAPNEPGLGVEMDWDVIEPNVVRRI